MCDWLYKFNNKAAQDKESIYKGGAVPEWSKALLVRDNNGKPKDPRFVPGLVILKKPSCALKGADALGR